MNDPSAFEEGTAMPPDVEARLLARLELEAEARHEAAFDATARGLLRRPSPLRQPLTWVVAALSAAAAVLLTWFLIGHRQADEVPLAFTPERPVQIADDVTIERDERGRLTRIAPAGDGEHLLFRAGRVIRVEPHRAGLVDGVVLEFDGSGGLVAVRTHARGVERGPWVELDGHGRVTGSGVR